MSTPADWKRIEELHKEAMRGTGGLLTCYSPEDETFILCHSPDMAARLRRALEDFEPELRLMNSYLADKLRKILTGEEGEGK